MTRRRLNMFRHAALASALVLGGLSAVAYGASSLSSGAIYGFGTGSNTHPCFVTCGGFDPSP